MSYIAFILIAVISYLLGSLNFGVILSNRVKNDDIRNHGSGNAGTTNMLRNYGKKIAFLTIAGDMLKVFVSIGISFAIIKFLPMAIDDFTAVTLKGIDSNIYIKSLSGFFCVLGHIFPCYFGFKGGKGVATAGGMVFAIDWRIGLILLVVFVLVLLVSKYVSLGSLVMALLYPVFIYVFHRSPALTGIAAVFTVVVVVAHRSNIKKLITHTESKISFKSKK